MNPPTVRPDRGAADSTLAPWGYVVIGAALGVTFAYLWVWGRRYGLDLRVYRQSVEVWHRGRDPYLASFTASHLPYTYPPFSLVVFTPLRLVSFAASQWAGWAVSTAAAAVSTWIVLRDRRVSHGRRRWAMAVVWGCLSLLVLEPARSGIDYGQIEFVLMVLVLADLMVVPHRFRGIALGVASAIKLTPLVFILVLLVRRDFRSSAQAVLSFVVLTAGTWLLWPGMSHLFWENDVLHPARVGAVNYGGNQSWYAVLHRSPFPATGLTAVWLVLSLATLGVGVFVAWRSVSADRQVFAVLAVALTGLLISPVSWTHHWVWVLLLPPMAIGPLRWQLPGLVRLLVWGLVAITVVSPYWWFRSGAPADLADAVLPLWTFGLLVTWAAFEYRAWRSRTTPAPEGGVGGASVAMQQSM